MPKPSPNETAESEGRALDAALSNYPGVRRVTATRRALRWLLLNVPSPVLLEGLSWSIKNRHLGAGVYEVWLERQP